MKCLLIAAISVDGFIAQRADQVSTSWTSGADKKWFSERTKQAGVIVMGSTTFKTINRPLPGRLTLVYTRTPEALAQFDPTQIKPTQASPRELLKELEQQGYTEVAICGGGSIYSQWMKSGLVTDLYLTVEPVIFGQGIGLFAEPHRRNLKLREQQSLSEDTVLMHYEVLPESTLA